MQLRRLLPDLILTNLVRTGYASDFSAPHNGFHGPAGFSSQSASRNGSYPPSRHGHEISPTDMTFSINDVNDRRPRGAQILDTLARPQSQGQSRQIYFGQVPADRRPSAPYLSSLGNTFGFDGAADSMSVRTGMGNSVAGSKHFHRRWFVSCLFDEDGDERDEVDGCVVETAQTAPLLEVESGPEVRG